MDDFIILGVPSLKEGSEIHIKKENRGKFTEYCDGKVTQKCIDKAKQSGNKKLVKRAVFAENAKAWKHQEGGTIEDQIVNRALTQKQPSSNYNSAVDLDVSKFREWATGALQYFGLPSGLSNCTLTASQWVNPSRPIGKAATIVTNSTKHNFVPVDQPELGTLVIASKNPEIYKDGEDNVYHSMIVTKFADHDYDFTYGNKTYKIKKGEPLVTYSRGKNDSSEYRQNIPLKVYNDQSDGKTTNRFYNYAENMLPEIDVVAERIRPKKYQK